MVSTRTAALARWVRPAGLIACLVVGLAVGLAGCATTAEVPDPPPTSMVPLPASSEPDPGALQERAVLAALEGFLASTIAANDPPDPAHPGLAAYRAGDLLAGAIDAVERNRELGVAFRHRDQSRYRHEPRIIELSERHAVVLNCVVDDALQVEIQTGRVIDDSVSTKRFRTVLELIEGQWRVVSNELLGSQEGDQGCDEL